VEIYNVMKFNSKEVLIYHSQAETVQRV